MENYKDGYGWFWHMQQHLSQEFQKNIYFCFIDYAKAFDCVDHNKLWRILQDPRVARESWGPLIPRSALEKDPRPGPLFEGYPVGEGTTRRGTATPVHRPQRHAGSTHSSTRGLRPPEQCERPAGFPASLHNSIFSPTNPTLTSRPALFTFALSEFSTVYCDPHSQRLWHSQ